MSTCPVCDGYGYIVTCCDDICVGGNHCIHSDGEEFCAACDGEGGIDDYEPGDVSDFYDDPTAAPAVCSRCGKEFEDFSDLGCEYCDRRHPGFIG